MKPFLFLAVPILLLTSCANGQTEARYPTGYDRTETGGNIYAAREGVFGKGGLCIGGNVTRSNGQSMKAFGATKISLATAIAAAETKTNGKAYDAGIDAESVVPRYEIKILKNGKVSKVLVDGLNGNIISITRSWII